MPVATFVSFRLGDADGVSVEARKWAAALRTLGYETRRVAGRLEGEPEPGDVLLPWLAIDATDAPRPAELTRVLADSDVVVVENLCSLPLNLAAARASAQVLAELPGRVRVLLHHHDLPWQRRSLAATADEFPPRLRDVVHVTINQRSRRELEARRHEPVVVLQNRFDLDAPRGERATTRKRLGFEDDELVVLQPSRAIERKNVPGGIRFADALARAYPERPVRYWLSGPAEDGYGPTLERVLARAAMPVTVGRAETAIDAYAAADVVALPSTWEGFGNPTIESIVARRPLAAFPYPVLSEILATGLRFFSVHEPATLARFLREADDVQERFHDVNLHRARLSYSLDDLPEAIEGALALAGGAR
jgi:glycosyltransferase involved in cell wall biosynthesis